MPLATGRNSQQQRLDHARQPPRLRSFLFDFHAGLELAEGHGVLPDLWREGRRVENDQTYWLRHCEGFRVETRDGRLGFVEEIREGKGPEGRETLAIRVGALGRRLLLVSATEVDVIVPRAKRIWLQSPVSIIGSDATGA
jgi:hypothetical protein